MGRSARRKNRVRRSASARAGQGDPPRTSSRSKKTLNIVLPLLIIALLVVILGSSFLGNPQTQNQIGKVVPVEAATAPTVVNTTQYELEPRTLNELLDIPSNELDRVDVARMNLLCATRLPSTESLDVEHALATLNEWARRAAFETDRHLYRVTDPNYADHYGHSEAQYRAEMLAQVLQEDLDIKYDPRAIGSFSFADPSVAFIYGMIPAARQSTSETPGGTCASMPVLYVAIGRRLGYPLKLVTTDSHIFVRWEGFEHETIAWRERFNIETTNGFHRFDDDYYRTWPKPVTAHQIAVNGFLKSLTPAEELAHFMASRGHHGMDVGQFGFAARCYENAHRYDMRRPCYVSWFAGAASQSNYQTRTASLVGVADRPQARSNTVRRNDFDAGIPGLPGMDIPLPSQTPLSDIDGLPSTHGVNTWAPLTPTHPTFAQQPQPGQPLGNQP